MDNTDNLSALRFAKAQADKKYIKKMSNVFSVPLILEQVFATAALIIAGVIMMLVRVSVLRQAGSFNMSTFMSFITQSNNSDCLNNIFSILVYFTYMFIPFVLIAVSLRQNPFKRVPMKVQHAELILPAISIGLFFSVIGEFYAGYFQSLLQVFNLKVELTQFSFPDNVPALIIYFLELSVFAPVCEEFIFRGMIMQNLRKYGDFFAVLLSSLMFGILHGNLAQTPFAFVVGLALGFTVIETGSIFIGMLLHCFINSISIIFSAIAYYGGDGLSNRVYFLYMLVVCILAVISFVSLKKKNFFKGAAGRYFSESMPVPQALNTFAKTPGFIIFVSFFSLAMLMSLQTL